MKLVVTFSLHHGWPRPMEDATRVANELARHLEGFHANYHAQLESVEVTKVDG